MKSRPRRNAPNVASRYSPSSLNRCANSSEFDLFHPSTQDRPTFSSACLSNLVTLSSPVNHRGAFRTSRSPPDFRANVSRGQAISGLGLCLLDRRPAWSGRNADLVRRADEALVRPLPIEKMEIASYGSDPRKCRRAWFTSRGASCCTQ